MDQLLNVVYHGQEPSYLQLVQKYGWVSIEFELKRSIYTHCTCYLGGAPNLPNGLPIAYQQGFRGCIQSVKINYKYLDLLKTPGTLQYCHENEV